MRNTAAERDLELIVVGIMLASPASAARVKELLGKFGVHRSDLWPVFRSICGEGGDTAAHVEFLKQRGVEVDAGTLPAQVIAAVVGAGLRRREKEILGLAEIERVMREPAWKETMIARLAEMQQS